MKLHQERTFHPITLTLETEEEAADFSHILHSIRKNDVDARPYDLSITICNLLTEHALF